MYKEQFIVELNASTAVKFSIMIAEVESFLNKSAGEVRFTKLGAVVSTVKLYNAELLLLFAWSLQVMLQLCEPSAMLLNEKFVAVLFRVEALDWFNAPSRYNEQFKVELNASTPVKLKFMDDELLM